MRRQRFYVQLIASWLVFAIGCERAAKEEIRLRVEGGEPVVQDIDVTLRYPVELLADETVSVAPVLARGQLTRVLVDVGDKVKAGQLVANLDCREYAAQGAQVAKAISQREAQVEESRKLLDRLLVMNEQHLIAPAELDRAKAAYRVAQAQLDEAKARLSEASQRQGYCSLKAPFDGYVSVRNLDPGAMVGPGEAVVTIVKTRAVTAVASVVEQDVGKVRQNADATIDLHAFPDQTFSGKVARVGRALDPSTRTLPIEIDIPNGSDTLLPGMTGRVEIVTERREDAILVPVTAVLNLEEASYVFVVQEKDGETLARRVEVELGVDLGDWLEIQKGLSAEDQVIMVGREIVAEGVLVELTGPQNLPKLPGSPSEDEEALAQAETDSDAQGKAASKEAESKLAKAAAVAVSTTVKKAKAQAPSRPPAPRAAKKRRARKRAQEDAAKKTPARPAKADGEGSSSSAQPLANKPPQSDESEANESDESEANESDESEANEEEGNEAEPQNDKPPQSDESEANEEEGDEAEPEESAQPVADEGAPNATAETGAAHP